MFETSCHCGNVQVNANQSPDKLTRCTCSICNRYGALWVYYDASDVSVVVGQFPISRYKWGTGRVTFHSCSHCACVVQHTSTDEQGNDKVGINARMASPETIKDLPLRVFDGADTWQFIEE